MPTYITETDSAVLSTVESHNLAKRCEVLIKTRQFVIVRLKGRDRGVMKISLTLCSCDELLIWCESRWCCVFVQPINGVVAPYSKKLLRLCTRAEKLFQYWYLALIICQYFASIYWFCSKGFITLLIIASKHKRLVSRIRHNIMEKLLLLLMVAQSQLKYL